jgi:hypothetical protein
VNAAITALISRLGGDGEQAQTFAAARISVLLERELKRPQASQEVCSVLLTADLVTVHLSPDEIEEIFDKLVASLWSDKLLRGTRLSLLWLIMGLADLKYGDQVINFFKHHLNTFNEQEAFSSLASLTIFLLRAKQDPSRFDQLLAEHDIAKLIQKFQTHPSERLRESAGRLMNFVALKPSR